MCYKSQLGVVLCDLAVEALPQMRVVSMWAVEGVHCSVYGSWFIMAGPRILSIGIITNSF